MSHVPVPRQALLAAEGVLSWTWYATQFSVRRATFQSFTPQSRKMDARFAERFADLAAASDEQIRRFAERWGPLRYGPPQPLESLEESVQEWRRYAALIAAIVRC